MLVLGVEDGGKGGVEGGGGAELSCDVVGLDGGEGCGAPRCAADGGVMAEVVGKGSDAWVAGEEGASGAAGGTTEGPGCAEGFDASGGTEGGPSPTPVPMELGGPDHHSPDLRWYLPEG